MGTQTIVESLERTASPLSRSSSGFSERTRILALAAASILVYANTLLNNFALDDFLYIFNNPAVTSPSLKLFFSATKDFNVFRPVTFIALALNWALGTVHPWGYHVVNLLLHAGVTLLLYLLLKKLLENLAYGITAAWVAALLFAVHPIHTEAVAGIVNRSELLAAGFLLAAWLLHLDDWSLPALLCFALAMMAKESAVVFVPLVILGDYVRGQWKSFVRYVSVAAVAGLYLAVLRKAQGGHFGEKGISGLDNPLAHLSPVLRISNAIRVAWKYIGLQIYPAALTSDYSYNAITLYADWKHLLPAVVGMALVLGLGIWALWTGRRAWAFAVGFYLAAFSVTANILTPTGTIMGERLAYLPSAGFCLLVALFWLELEKRNRRVAWYALAVVALLFSARTILRNRDWRDTFTIYSAAVRTVPNSAKSHAGLGEQYLRRNQLQDARKEFQTSLTIYPDFADLIDSYAIVESRLGHDQQALELFERSLALTAKDDIDYESVAVNLAAQFMKMGDNDKALKILNDQIAANTNDSRAFSNRAVIRYQRAEYPSALADAQAALKLDPTNVQAQRVAALLTTKWTVKNATP
jgi:protein O-mannosyl-transferase